MKILIVALEYLEPEWKQTKKCIEDTGLDVLYVSRDGVGNISRAFNTGMEMFKNYDLIWFVTNIVFSPECPQILAEHIGDYSAIHPAMATSDHIHLHPTKGVQEVKFVEFTSPMFKSADFIAIGGLDEDLWHYYMDLDICARLATLGKKFAVDGENIIGHVYLRNNVKHPITKIREQLRNLMAEHGKQKMSIKYGKDWRNKVWNF
jgi:hypothetical protein